jgi:hypothetical protein
MKRRIFLASLMLLITAAVVFPDGLKEIKEILTGYEEVPALSTTGGGELRARISRDGTSISYQLSYSDLEGNVTQSHIHLGNPGVNGGISVFLCTNLNNGPAGTQPCPPAPATITGTLTAADVIGPAGQGIGPGEFSELVQAIRARSTYVNIHSTKYPGGEVRKQILPDEKGDHDH